MLEYHKDKNIYAGTFRDALIKAPLAKLIVECSVNFPKYKDDMKIIIKPVYKYGSQWQLMNVCDIEGNFIFSYLDFIGISDPVEYLELDCTYINRKRVSCSTKCIRSKP